MTFGIGTNFGLPSSGETPSAPGLCVVRFVVTDNATPVEGAIVHVKLEDENPMVSQILISRIVHTGYTDEDGILDVEMIQISQFVRGGIYRVRVSDAGGRRLHERRVTVPDQDSAYAADLADAL